MKKQGIKNFFKPVSTNSNVAKETDPVSCKKHLQKLDQKKNKEDAFSRTKFRNWKKAITSFRDHQQSKCHLAALTFEVTVPQCLHVIAFANLYTKSKDNRKRMFRKFTKKTCKITMTNFLLSFSLYLVS